LMLSWRSCLNLSVMAASLLTGMKNSRWDIFTMQ
jgi:hypothetical protein